MLLINYIFLILGLSWPVLVIAFLVSWLFLRKRRPLGIFGVLYFVLISLALFLAVSFAVSIAWLPQFGPPTLYPYIYGPSLVAAVLVFPGMCWWFIKRTS